MSEIRLTLDEQRAIVTAADKWAWPHDEFAGDLFAAVEAIIAARLTELGQLAQEPTWGWRTIQEYWRKMSEIRWATGTETPSDVHNQTAALAPPARPESEGASHG